MDCTADKVQLLIKAFSDDSFMAWDGTNHPFEAWNGNQYFEEIDKQIGGAAIQDYIRKIGG